MLSLSIVLLLFTFVEIVLLQGSGLNGNLRLCVVEGRGIYKRVSKYCPVLDEEKSGIECVVGTDRLDCLRRISKGKVDFGVFSPEDLIAAQWANIDVLVTNVLMSRNRPFERSVTAVVNRRILLSGTSTVHTTLRGSTLCHPEVAEDKLRPLSDTLTGYIELLVTEKQCNESLSLLENRIKGVADFFGNACKPGPWVADKKRDLELKQKYSSLCRACASTKCAVGDRYWGASGALGCLNDGAGDVTWAELDDITAYFKLSDPIPAPAVGSLAYLCRNGTWQPLTNNSEPCVWLHKPWPIVIAKRKVAEAVAKLTMSLTQNTVVVDQHWQGALAALLEIRQSLPAPLQPPKSPMDYLATAYGFREAYSQTGCHPPRHITLCTKSILEKSKCEWLSEAAAVYGIAPPLQCSFMNSTKECLNSVEKGDSDVTVANSDWLVAGMRDFKVTPVLHESTPIVEKTNTIVAYVRKSDKITKMADLRRKRASFPRFDGLAWHSVLRYFANKEKETCNQIVHYFSSVCAPLVENHNFTPDTVNFLTNNCYKEDGKILDGELQALRSVVEGKSDVAFISMDTYNLFKANLIVEPWGSLNVEIQPVCPEENMQYCFLTWSNIGHIFAARNLTSMRRQEITNVFMKFDELFGKQYPFHSAMFSMYGPFNHQMDVLFHNKTRMLATDYMLESHPYNTIPLYFDRSIINVTSDSCEFSDVSDFGVKSSSSVLIIVISLVFTLLYR